jgi:hypothetical protein
MGRDWSSEIQAGTRTSELCRPLTVGVWSTETETRSLVMVLYTGTDAHRNPDVTHTAVVFTFWYLYTGGFGWRYNTATSMITAGVARL